LHFEEGAMASSVIAQLSLRGHLQIALNQELIENDNTILHDGDTLEIFRPAAGG
jgi:molybdopterin converting factor small subunit